MQKILISASAYSNATSQIIKMLRFSPKDYSQESLDLFIDNIKDDRSDLDLLFDCMLRWGVELSMPLKTTKVEGCTIHNVDDGKTWLHASMVL